MHVATLASHECTRCSRTCSKAVSLILETGLEDVSAVVMMCRLDVAESITEHPFTPVQVSLFSEQSQEA